MEKEERKYKCRWCEYKFTKMISITGGDHVKCPKCGNFLKT